VKKFAEAFVRNADGSWFCRAPAEFVIPERGRFDVTPGVTYRRGHSPVGGADVAKWLDEWHSDGAMPPGVKFL
jgi:hypothetical protein